MKLVTEAVNLSSSEIENEIIERKELLKKMVGTLYPGIVKEEIIKLRIVYFEKTGKS